MNMEYEKVSMDFLMKRYFECKPSFIKFRHATDEFIYNCDMKNREIRIIFKKPSDLEKLVFCNFISDLLVSVPSNTLRILELNEQGIIKKTFKLKD